MKKKGKKFDFYKTFLGKKKENNLGRQLKTKKKTKNPTPPPPHKIKYNPS